jgi:hypothetical protein
MAKSFHLTDMPMMKKNKQWRLVASFFCLNLLFSACSFAGQPTLEPVTAAKQHAIAPAGLTPFNARYQVLRSGKVHGEAERYIKPYGRGYELGYRSKINWLIFKDERHELSRFNLVDGHLQPFFYQLRRWGTGPGRHYELNLDWTTKQLQIGKDKATKPLQTDTRWLDALSYHSLLVLELATGKKEFSFQVLGRNGDSRLYHYKATAEELLAVPAGKIKTIRIERVSDKQGKQVIAWVAPELDYMLVRLWQAEDNVEQFDIQLASYQSATAK